jgi:hypothetical protein
MYKDDDDRGKVVDQILSKMSSDEGYKDLTSKVLKTMGLSSIDELDGDAEKIA